jgi:Gametolysin peptidase M11
MDSGTSEDGFLKERVTQGVLDRRNNSDHRAMNAEMRRARSWTAGSDSYRRQPASRSRRFAARSPLSGARGHACSRPPAGQDTKEDPSGEQHPGKGFGCQSHELLSVSMSVHFGGVRTYSRYLYAFPQNACTWWGLASVGGNPSQAWVNGSLALLVVGHEMGHNFGLYHSNGLDCGSSLIGTNCTAIEYADSLDMMGEMRGMHFNAFQKERLGWMNYGASPIVTTVEADGTCWLEPYEWHPRVPRR